MASQEAAERYRLRGVDLRSVSDEVDSLWHRLQGDQGLKADCKDAGIDVSEFANVRRDSVITVRTEGHGIDGSMVLDVSFAAVISGAHILVYDLWKQVLLPRLKKKFGKDALNSEAPKEKATKSKRETPKKGRPADKKVRAGVGKRSAAKKANRR